MREIVWQRKLSTEYLSVPITVIFVPAHFHFRLRNDPETAVSDSKTAVLESKTAVSDFEAAISDAKTAISEFETGAR